MKKIILVLIAIVSFTATYGQSKWHQKQNNHFVEAAAKEYNLNDDQKDGLAETRLSMVKTFMDFNKEFKSGNITEDEKKAKTREASKKFNTYFAKLVGKPFKELKPFMERMRGELKNLK